MPGLILFLGLFLLAFAALLSPTRGDEPEWRPLEDFNAVWIPRWSVEYYEDPCCVPEASAHTISQVYLAWDAQEGASGYDFKIERKEEIMPPPMDYLLSGDAVPEDIPQPAMGIARLDRWEPGTSLAAGLIDAEMECYNQIAIIHNDYNCYLKPIYNYQIAMEFEYLAGEPPVITGTGTKTDNITMEHPLRFDPRDSTSIRLKIKFRNENNQPIVSEQFRLKIRYFQIPDDSVEPLSNFEFKRGGHNHLDDYDGTLAWNGTVYSYGRPLFHMHGSGLPTSDDNGNIIREYYYRGVYNVVKTTDTAGEYQVTFDPYGSYGTIPTGGRMEFEVYYPDVNAATPAYNDYMEVYVPNLTRMNASPNGHYTLVGGTSTHPGPPADSQNNWNHYATGTAVAWLTTLAYHYDSEHNEPLEYNDMLLKCGGKFELGCKTDPVTRDSVPAPFWALDSSHYEHYGYVGDGNSCDMNFGNPRYIDDTEIEWIKTYVKDNFPKLPSKKPRCYDEGNHLHFRIYDKLLENTTFPDPTAYP